MADIKSKVEHLMAKEVVTIVAEADEVDAAAIMAKNKFKDIE